MYSINELLNNNLKYDLDIIGIIIQAQWLRVKIYFYKMGFAKIGLKILGERPRLKSVRLGTFLALCMVSGSFICWINAERSLVCKPNEHLPFFLFEHVQNLVLVFLPV